MAKITVYPLAPNSLVIVHPSDGPLYPTGSSWDEDGFTCRMLVDGEITTDQSQSQAAQINTPPTVTEP